MFPSYGFEKRKSNLVEVYRLSRENESAETLQYNGWIVGGGEYIRNFVIFELFGNAEHKFLEEVNVKDCRVNTFQF